MPASFSKRAIILYARLTFGNVLTPSSRLARASTPYGIKAVDPQLAVRGSST
jgi:hypothetical protein